MGSPQFSPYVSFPGNAGQAFAYYKDVFGGELDIMRYDDFPDLSGFPFTPPPGTVAHAQLDGGLVTLAGGDAMPGPGETAPAVTSEVFSFLVGLDTVPEAEALIEKLVSTGSTVSMPFEVAPWGDHYGQVTDKFGIMWAVVVGAQRE